jgi:predicted GNAT family acetyltransferase
MSEFNGEIVFDHDEERQTFDAIVGDERATLEYRSNKEGKIFLTHTEVPPPIQGKGVGEALVKHVFEYIEENGMRMIPTCPFVKAYLRKHPEYKKLVASGIRIV